jgi:cathepsin F
MLKVLLVVCAFAAVVYAGEQHPTALLQQFAAWQLKFKKTYDTVAEFDHAIDNFKASLARVEANNKRTGGTFYGLTKFSDLSPAEFKTLYLRCGHKGKTQPRSAGANVLPHTHKKAPASFDWRTHSPKVVTDVKDQGQCGSCWAFSATENIESMWALKGHDLVELAPEQIVDCDTVDGGCNGGDTPTAFQYVMSAGGLERETTYPYTAGQSGTSGTCNFDKSSVVASIGNFSWVIPECMDSCDNQQMAPVKTYLSTVGPFAICVFAEPWQDYSGGIFNDQGCSHDAPSLDHCVQLVGYTDSYWIVRNSWNSDWGEAGYIYVSTKEVKGNLCGVLDEVNFAVSL